MENREDDNLKDREMKAPRYQETHGEAKMETSLGSLFALAKTSTQHPNAPAALSA